MCATRYGNVMASRGSVISLFVKQLKEGRDLTVTDPNMTRFLMSLQDLIDLVLFAFTAGRQGDIFVQKAPACTLRDLAEAMRIVFNKKNSIQIIGTRHGEKLYELLVSREEMARAQDLGRFFQIPVEDRNLNYSGFFTDGEPLVSRTEDYNSHNTERLNVDQVVELLLGLDYIQNELKGEAPRRLKALG